MDAPISDPFSSKHIYTLKDTLECEMMEIDAVPKALMPLPDSVLLVSLPSLLVHPPTHRYHEQSLCLSILALKRCLMIPNLSPEIECRAWASLAELGVNVIAAGLSQDEDHPWAKGMELEVERAVSKGLQIAQKHPPLRAYRPHLTCLSAQLSQWQQNNKFARNMLRRLLTTFLPTDPPHIVYSAHLMLISHYVNSVTSTKTTVSPRPRPMVDIHAAIFAIQTLGSMAEDQGHSQVVMLAHVMKLRVVVSFGLWDQVDTALLSVEDCLGIKPRNTTKQPLQASNGGRQSTGKPVIPQFEKFEDAFTTSMAVHSLIMAVVYYTHLGIDSESAPRLAHLHFLLDGGALKNAGCGIVEILFAESQSLFIQMTHPRVLLVLAYLVSSVAKRDPVGRKPRRKLFAIEGLAMLDREMKNELIVPQWASAADVQEINLKLMKMKGDLYCELISVSILRSEFAIAEENLNLLICHCRNHDIFDRFSARITLHHAHLAHVKGDTEKALQCYCIASQLAKNADDLYVQWSAHAGEVAIRIGLYRTRTQMKRSQNSMSGQDESDEWTDIVSLGNDVAEVSKGLGGGMRSVGQIIEACLSNEILQAKSHLKSALSDASNALDNHLRALIIALLSSHFFHTAPEHALEMLSTCDQLASGLGAAPSRSKGKEKDNVGNGPLRLWVGDRFLELYKRLGNNTRIKKQEIANDMLREAVRAGQEMVRKS